jgi:hypothetical protein
MPEGEAKRYWLDGNFAPVQEEITSFALAVEGALPPELSGLYARNGANPRDGHAGHWFLGDGMDPDRAGMSPATAPSCATISRAIGRRPTVSPTASRASSRRCPAVRARAG